jgi:hypothetical protein
MKNIKFLIFYLLSLYPCLNAQQTPPSFELETIGGYISSGQVPFWLRSNQFGSIPSDKGSLSFIGAMHKDYNRNKSGLIDYGVSFEGRANIGHKSDFYIIEGYAKLRIGVFEIRGGRSKEIIGLCDTSLSSGSWAVSGNAPGIPKVQINIPEFYTLPIFGRMFAFRGNYAHGWLGSIPMNRNGEILYIGTYLHQKSLYGRFGKPEWKVKLYGGFNHQVLWGNEKAYWGETYNLSVFQTYLYVLTGRGWSGSRMGDELGSIDLGFEYSFSNIRILVYRQNVYDAGALYYLANIRDGLNGLSITNKHFNLKSFFWEKVLLEILYTKNQAGEPWSKHTPSGDEDYFNHYIYMNGWSYHQIGLGNPLITPDYFVKTDLPTVTSQYFNNNRVIAIHSGFTGGFMCWKVALKATYSFNNGTYKNESVFPKTKQFSAFFDVHREVDHKINLGFSGAFDVGELYYNSFGLLARISKSF